MDRFVPFGVGRKSAGPCICMPVRCMIRMGFYCPELEEKYEERHVE
jgi:hypothetical protein